MDRGAVARKFVAARDGVAASRRLALDDVLARDADGAVRTNVVWDESGSFANDTCVVRDGQLYRGRAHRLLLHRARAR